MEKKKNPKQGQAKMQMHVDEEVAQGVYSNLAMIYHSENEFVLDFCYVQPGPPPPRAKVRSRVILSPRHARRLMEALQGNVSKYEKRFGAITPPKDDTHTFH
jgi:hypothetical protein